MGFASSLAGRCGPQSPPELQQPSAPQLDSNNQNGIGGSPPPPPNPPDSSSPFPGPETPSNTPSPAGQVPDASSAPNHNGDSSGVSPDVNHGPAPQQDAFPGANPAGRDGGGAAFDGGLTPPGASSPAGQGRSHSGALSGDGDYFGAPLNEGQGRGPALRDAFSHANPVGNNSGGSALGAFSGGAGVSSGAPYAASPPSGAGTLSASLLNMGLPAFAAAPAFTPGFEPKRDSEPPYRPQVQPQPPQPQPRPELQSAVQAQ